jgi:hypothetical protein
VRGRITWKKSKKRASHLGLRHDVKNRNPVFFVDNAEQHGSWTSHQAETGDPTRLGPDGFKLNRFSSDKTKQ